MVTSSRCAGVFHFLINNYKCIFFISLTSEYLSVLMANYTEIKKIFKRLEQFAETGHTCQPRCLIHAAHPLPCQFSPQVKHHPLNTKTRSA